MNLLVYSTKDITLFEGVLKLSQGRLGLLTKIVYSCIRNIILMLQKLLIVSEGTLYVFRNRYILLERLRKNYLKLIQNSLTTNVTKINKPILKHCNWCLQSWFLLSNNKWHKVRGASAETADFKFDILLLYLEKSTPGFPHDLLYKANVDMNDGNA